MQQHEFIYVAHNIGLKPYQDKIGNTIIDLKAEKLRLFHNYRRNRMQLRFEEDAAVYLITEDKELEQIYRLYMENDNSIQLIRDYCDRNLKKQH